MRTLRRYLASEIIAATGLVMLALLMLFAFFDLVEEMKDLGRGGYRMKNIALHVLLSVPDARLRGLPDRGADRHALRARAARREHRVHGDPHFGRVAAALQRRAAHRSARCSRCITFAFGEFVGPPAEQFAQRLRSLAIAGIVAQEFRSGLWVKDGRNFINVGEVTPDAKLKRVRIYEFDEDYRLRTLIARRDAATYKRDRTWTLTGVVRTTFEDTRTQVRADTASSNGRPCSSRSSCRCCSCGPSGCRRGTSIRTRST